MKKNLLNAICFIAIALIGINKSFAQESVSVSSITAPPLFSGNNGFRTWSVGIHAGAMMPFSAFGGKTSFSNGLQTLAYGGYIKYQASHVIGIQVDVIGGSNNAISDFANYR